MKIDIKSLEKEIKELRELIKNQNEALFLALAVQISINKFLIGFQS